MSQFYIGQKVVCVNTKHTPHLVKDKVYTVLQMRQGCCSLELDVLGDRTDGFVLCTICGSMRPAVGIWHRHTRFVPLDILEMELTIEFTEKASV